MNQTNEIMTLEMQGFKVAKTTNEGVVLTKGETEVLVRKTGKTQVLRGSL